MTRPGSTPSENAAADLSALLQQALVARTREAFTSLLTSDVRWGGERRGTGHECTSREEAGDHYVDLLEAGVRLRIADLQPSGNAAAEERQTYGSDHDEFTATMQISSPDPDDFLSEMAVRLSLRDGLISDICILDPPPSIEVLYFDGCPHFDVFVPHLRALLAQHDVAATITLTRVEDDEAAHAYRFLGSPSVRVDGRDVEPDAAERQDAHEDDTDRGDERFAMQCRLYSTPDGVTGSPQDQWILDALIANPVHEAAIAAIGAGDIQALQKLLDEHSDLASTRLARREGRTLLHVATDWPGHYPNVAATIGALVAAGADPDTGCLGEHRETPLHWAASSNDIAAIDALLAAGADINAPGAVIAGGTPMADATAFGQWGAARRLLELGARTNLFEAAALGLVDQVRHHLDTDHPAPDLVTSSFWGACHGGQVATAAVLLEHGADINWVGYDDLTPLDAARRAKAPAVIEWLEGHDAVSAQPA